MRTEDVLAACLDAQAQGRSPAAILDQDATPEQRAELESLLDLAGRLGRLAPPRLPPTRREAMGGRILAALDAPPGAPIPMTGSAPRRYTVSRPSSNSVARISGAISARTVKRKLDASWTYPATQPCSWLYGSSSAESSSSAPGNSHSNQGQAAALPAPPIMTFTLNFSEAGHWLVLLLIAALAGLIVELVRGGAIPLGFVGEIAFAFLGAWLGGDVLQTRFPCCPSRPWRAWR